MTTGSGRTGGSTRRARRVAVLFGGRSLEHDVSVVSGLQIAHALDPTRYDVVPVYIDQQLRWWIGDALWHAQTFTRAGRVRAPLNEVTLSPGFGTSRLVPAQRRWRGGRVELPIDVFLPVLHGTFGEDGCIQGLLELGGCAYVGCGVTASALGMNKRLSKVLASHADVPVVPWLSCARDVLERGATWTDELTAAVDERFGWPVIVKPCNLGSSAGVSTAASSDDLVASVLRVFECDVEALVEPFLTNRLELNVAVAGLGPPVASVPEMPVTAQASPLTFSEKYKRQGRKSIGSSEGMAGALRVLDPTDVPAQVRQRAQSYATTVFSALGCEGIARIDFLIDIDRDDWGGLYFNEINTLPGSLAFYLWSAAPHFWTITELLDKLIARAEHLQATGRGLRRQPSADLTLLG